jgi:hypothetical protein
MLLKASEPGRVVVGGGAVGVDVVSEEVGVEQDSKAEEEYQD